MCRLLCLLSLFGLLGVSPLAAQSPPTTAHHTTCIASDTFIALSLDVPSLLSHIKPDSRTRKAIDALFAQEMGIQVQDVQQLTFQFGMPKGDDLDDDMFMCLVRFKKPPAIQTILEKEGSTYETAKHNGRQYHRPSNEYAPSMYVYENTLVMAIEARLLQVIGKEKQASPVAEMLKKARPGNDLVGLYLRGEGRDEIYDEVIEELAEEFLDGVSIDVAGMLKEAKSGVLQANFRRPDSARLRLEMNREVEAKKLAFATKTLFKLARRTLAEVKEESKQWINKESDEEEKQAYRLMEKLFALSDKFFDNVQTRHEKQLVLMKAGAADGFAEAPMLFLNWLGLIAVQEAGVEIEALEVQEVEDKVIVDEVQKEAVEEAPPR